MRPYCYECSRACKCEIQRLWRHYNRMLFGNIFIASVSHIFMKTLAILALVVLAGCAAKPTLSELEEQALATGDWTEVEARERGINRLRRTTAPKCADGATMVCVQNSGVSDCQCRKGSQTASIFSE